MPDFGEQHFHSFAGADIKVNFGHREVGELQAISYAIQREKAPIYTLGSKNPSGFSRGKRGIAGTLVFSVQDGHPLLEYLGQWAEAGTSAPEFLSDKREYRPQSDDPVGPIAVGDIYDGSDAFIESDTSIDFHAGYELSGAWYVDQIPPFDVTITAANEYGAAMAMRIIGIEILNEGYGVSVDDIVSEKQMTYVARTLSPWRRVKEWRMDYTGGQSSVVEA